MARDNIYAVLLAGGKGTRLWPLSTGSFSKSFAPIGKEKPLIEKAIKRLNGLIGKKNILIVVDKAQRRLLKRFTKGIPRRNILVEPFGRSTASAVGLAAIALHPEDIIVVLPTDSVLSQVSAFQKAIKRAVNFVRDGENILMCIGIKPKEASTAYGYIKTKKRRKGNVYSVDRFMEKPKKRIAEKLIKKANYLWNAGIFIFKAKDILEAMRKHAPLLYRGLAAIKKNKSKKTMAYSRMRNVSIDYQIMEKAKNLYCLKADFSWYDLGSWTSLEKLFKKDKNGNICFGKAALLRTRDSIVYNSKKDKLAVVGLKGAIIVQTENGTLLCSKEDAEQVKKIAE